MRLTLLLRSVLALAAVVLPATLLHAALQSPADTPAPASSLAGQVLIAEPSMSDPRFYHAVILMVHHDAKGAFGLVINHPLGERPLATLLEAMGEKDSTATGTLRIFLGGPVQPQIGFVIHSTDYHQPETVDIDGKVAVTTSRAAFLDIAHQRGPQKALVAFGYAGWGAHQLEDELSQHAWFTAKPDSKLIFDEDREKVWDDAMSRRTQDL
jgi:putative transcriptional regulator